MYFTLYLLLPLNCVTTLQNFRQTGKDKDTHIVIIANNFTASVELALEQEENHELEVSIISNNTSDGINEKKGKFLSKFQTGGYSTPLTTLLMAILSGQLNVFLRIKMHYKRRILIYNS